LAIGRRRALPLISKASQCLDDEALAKAVRVLCRREPRFKPVVKAHGIPSLRAGTKGLEGMLTIVTEQFLSLAAARAIWLRLEARLKPFAHDHILACPQAELVSLGLSNAKAKSFHGLAQAAQDGRFDHDDLMQMDDEAAQKNLIALPGVGPWTADIYLLSACLRADVWPWGDVALQAAAQDLFKLKDRPDKKRMLQLAEPFRPYRAVLARLLWSHYRGLKAMKQAE
jgi:DNA-3-methyladenine glycosylase II